MQPEGLLKPANGRVGQRSEDARNLHHDGMPRGDEQVGSAHVDGPAQDRVPVERDGIQAGGDARPRAARPPERDMPS